MLDNRNEQDIQESDKVHLRNQEKLERGTDHGRKKFSWGENPEKYFPGRCAFTITFCNSYDAT